MLRHHSPMGGLFPLGRPAVRKSAIRLRPARGEDRMALGRLLTAAGVSRTGLQPQPGGVYVLDAASCPSIAAICWAASSWSMRPGSLSCTRSWSRRTRRSGHDALLLDLALKIAYEGGAEEALLLVETAAQVPATRLDSVPWAHVRACFPPPRWCASLAPSTRPPWPCAWPCPRSTAPSGCSSPTAAAAAPPAWRPPPSRRAEYGAPAHDPRARRLRQRDFLGREPAFGPE